MGFDWGERENNGVGVRFVLLAHSVTLNVLVHELCEPWASELGCDKLTSLEIPRVVSSLMVVAVDKDRMAEGTFGWNIHMPFVCEDVVIVFPIRKVRLECCGDVFQGRLQVLQDEGIRLTVRCKTIAMSNLKPGHKVPCNQLW